LNPVHFSSATDLWATPQEFFDAYDLAYGFGTDVCATAENAKAPLFYTPEQNGLAQDWRGVCWMNPPYGRGIDLWVKKAYEEAKHHGATVVCLLPARTDTRWWHDYCIKGQIEFIKGRLKFGEAKNSAPFPNAVVVFKDLAA
jgi:phage N-6-adenine-methyltransferase